MNFPSFTRECRRMEPLLAALPDGALPPRDAARLEAHLAGCAACRRDAELLEGVNRSLRAALSPPSGVVLPSGSAIAARILERDAQAVHPAPRPLRSLQRRPLAWASAAVLTAAAMAYAFRPEPARTVHIPPAPPPEATAPESLPVLVVSDDEESGRQVQLVTTPSTEHGGGGG